MKLIIDNGIVILITVYIEMTLKSNDMSHLYHNYSDSVRPVIYIDLLFHLLVCINSSIAKKLAVNSHIMF